MRHKKHEAGRSFVDPSAIFGKMEIPRKNKKDLYAKQREEDSLRQARENGYFLNITKSFIEQNFAPEMEGDDELIRNDDDCPYLIQNLRKKVRRRDIGRVYLVNLPKMHLRSLGDIGACKNLTVCILSMNFVNRFDALINCPNLTKIDLHGNQIVIIPDTYFWKSLGCLRILHLHDNPISNLRNLTASLSLVALTVFDTPMSLRHSYRHHLVNSIWTLKALDHHVISDEELIEDAHFRGNFAALSAPFKINLCASPKEEATFEEEVKAVRNTLQSIEHILVHNSPVLIIQRCIRGYLARRKVHRYVLKLPSVPSPLNETPRGHQDESSEQDEDVNENWRESADGAELRRALEDGEVRPRMQQRIHIDMSRLRKTLNTLHDDAQSSVTYSEQRELQGAVPTMVSKSSVKGGGKIASSKSVKFINRIDDMTIDSGDGEAAQRDQFYLQGIPKEPIYCDPIYYVMMEKKGIGSEVRNALAANYRKAKVKIGSSKRDCGKSNLRSNEERFFQKTQATMDFSCLRAVQQAYRQRDVAEKKAARAGVVSELRQRREDGHFRVKLYKQEQRSSVVKARLMDRYDIMNILRQQELRRQLELEEMRERSDQWEGLCSSKKDEGSFMREFSGSLMSLAKSQFAAKSAFDKEATRSEKEGKKSKKVEQKAEKRIKGAQIDKENKDQTENRQERLGNQ